MDAAIMDVQASGLTTREAEDRTSLLRSDWLADLDPIDLEFLVRFAERHTYEPGSWLFHEGAAREWFGFVIGGEVELVHPRDRSVPVSTLGVGSPLGEGILLETRLHTVSALTRTGAIVLRWPLVALDEIRCARPTVFRRLKVRAAQLTTHGRSHAG